MRRGGSGRLAKLVQEFTTGSHPTGGVNILAAICEAIDERAGVGCAPAAARVLDTVASNTALLVNSSGRPRNALVVDARALHAHVAKLIAAVDADERAAPADVAAAVYAAASIRLAGDAERNAIGAMVGRRSVALKSAHLDSTTVCKVFWGVTALRALTNKKMVEQWALRAGRIRVVPPGESLRHVANAVWAAGTVGMQAHRITGLLGVANTVVTGNPAGRPPAQQQQQQQQQSSAPLLPYREYASLMWGLAAVRALDHQLLAYAHTRTVVSAPTPGTAAAPLPPGVTVDRALRVAWAAAAVRARDVYTATMACVAHDEVVLALTWREVARAAQAAAKGRVALPPGVVRRIYDLLHTLEGDARHTPAGGASPATHVMTHHDAVASTLCGLYQSGTPADYGVFYTRWWLGVGAAGTAGRDAACRASGPGATTDADAMPTTSTAALVKQLPSVVEAFAAGGLLTREDVDALSEGVFARSDLVDVTLACFEAAARGLRKGASDGHRRGTGGGHADAVREAWGRTLTRVARGIKNLPAKAQTAKNGRRLLEAMLSLSPVGAHTDAEYLLLFVCFEAAHRSRDGVAETFAALELALKRPELWGFARGLLEVVLDRVARGEEGTAGAPPAAAPADDAAGRPRAVMTTSREWIITLRVVKFIASGRNTKPRLPGWVRRELRDTHGEVFRRMTDATDHLQSIRVLVDTAVRDPGVWRALVDAFIAWASTPIAARPSSQTTASCIALRKYLAGPAAAGIPRPAHAAFAQALADVLARAPQKNDAPQPRAGHMTAAPPSPAPPAQQAASVLPWHVS